MPVGSGFPIGDFLAALQLAAAIIDALCESSYACPSFHSLIFKNYAPEPALLCIKHLDPAVSRNVEKVALPPAAPQRWGTVDGIYKNIQRYQPHLQRGGTDFKVRDIWPNIKRFVCKKDDLDNFRAETRGHTSSTEILMLALQMKVVTGLHGLKTLITKASPTEYRIPRAKQSVCSELCQIALRRAFSKGNRYLSLSSRWFRSISASFTIGHNIYLFILRISGQT